MPLCRTHQVRNRVITEAMFVLDLVGMLAAKDVARNVQNVLEGEVTLLESLSVPN